MNTRHNLIALATITALLMAAAAGWWLGARHGQSQADTRSSASDLATAQTPAATADPSQWSIRQGEEATRRHIRDALKAGDLDPVTGRRILNYHDPMVPGQNFDAPAKSPFMDMMLVPRYAGSEGADTGTVSVSPRMQQSLGVRTVAVTQGVLAPELTAVGDVAWNERDRMEIGARATGFVEKLHVKAAFDRVRAGSPLLELYVPDWVAVQEEYLAVAGMSGEGTGPLKEAALQRMRQAGMGEDHVRRVVASGRLQPRLTLTAPRDGIVTELGVREGATVTPGMTLMRLQGTDTVWAEGALPESQVAQVARGTRVRITSTGMPGQTLDGRVQALLPQVDAITRTVRVRVELANPQQRLLPGMQVRMTFDGPAGARTWLVPTEAVMHTGRRSVVIVAEEGGRFRIAEVKVGLEANEQTEVKSGLQPGERVVLSGQFLIDSEASLRGLALRLNQEAGSQGGAQRYSTTAVVDAFAGDTVTLTHPPIPALKWPEMQMDFRLPTQERRPRRLEVGDRLQIEFELGDGDVPRITGIKPLPPEQAR